MKPLPRTRASNSTAAATPAATARHPKVLFLAFVAASTFFSAAQMFLVWLHPPDDSSSRTSSSSNRGSLSLAAVALFGYRHNRHDRDRGGRRPRRRRRRRHEKGGSGSGSGSGGGDSPISQSSVKRKGNKPNYHVVFSTSCGKQQDWESLVFFYHASKVGQPGNVTRIASGCSKKETAELDEFHRRYIAPLNPGNFHVHFTPGYGRIHEQLVGLGGPPPPGQGGGAGASHPHQGPYKYMNKPFGLLHWMESSTGLAMSRPSISSSSSDDDDIVFLLDPDMVLLRPIVHDYSTNEGAAGGESGGGGGAGGGEEGGGHVLWAEQQDVAGGNGDSSYSGGDPPDHRRMVRQGNPIAQQDPFLGNQWMRLRMPNFTKPPDSEGPLRWNAGPPYIATVRDMYRLAVRWTELAPQVLRVHDHLFAEMYGLIFAAVQLELPFTLVRSFVVSETASKVREGWAYVDRLSDQQVCQPLSQISAPLPVTMHYCERYMLGRFFFMKYRIKKSILQCDKPLLRMPPVDAYPRFDYNIEPPRADGADRRNYSEVHSPVKGGQRQAKREAFMLCHMTRAVNEALRYYKRLACPIASANLNETWSVYDDPADS